MSKDNSISFEPLKTLSTSYWSSNKLKDQWKWRDRSMESVMQRFIELNGRNLDFLDINVSIESDGLRPTLKLTSSKYIGAIPVRSPMNGKIVGDLTVKGRFGENATELIPLLGDNIKIEYSDEFRLMQEPLITPPIYIECCKYIDTYIEAKKYRWRKFDNAVKIQHQPSTSTLWSEYALRTAKDPMLFNVYHNKCNILSTDHKEWRQLTYVLTLAIKELQSPKVPIKIRFTYADKINHLIVMLRQTSMERTSEIRIKMSDPLIIKKLKTIAVSILNNKSNENTAWRMDYAEFFERYVQYLMSRVAKRKNVNVYNNPHYNISIKNMPSWGLNYLEPDTVLQKNNLQYVVDAKYKSHVFNWHDNNYELKDTFRHDFHQILAYCSFNIMPQKKALLIYPFNRVVVHEMHIKSNCQSSNADIYIVGIPIAKNKIEETEDKLSCIINF